MSFTFSSIYKTQFEAIHAINLHLIEWNMADKHQRFCQYLESNYSTLMLPQYLYESFDQYEVYSYIIDVIENDKFVE